MDYQVVIPMAGQGQRFVDKGYVNPKPLIPIAGVPLVNKVVGMFSEDAPITFVVNERHAAESPILRHLSDLRRNSATVTMPEHKRGPVWTVAAAFDHVLDDLPVFVAYCDGVVPFSHLGFNTWVTANKLDGCLFTHRGFHPHTLSATKMAYLQTEGLRVTAVKEKESYTDRPELEHASSGVYWFASGRLMKDHFTRALALPRLAYNGEHYVTLAYNSLIEAGLRVGFYETGYVEILGTPEEVENYEAWRTLLHNPHLQTSAQAAACFDYYDRLRTSW